MPWRSDVVNNESRAVVRDRLLRVLRRLDAPDTAEIRIALDVSDCDWNRYAKQLSRLVAAGIVSRDVVTMPSARGKPQRFNCYRLAHVSMR